MQMHRPFCEPALSTAFDTLYTYVHSGLALHGLQNTKDPKVAADLKQCPEWRLQSGWRTESALWCTERGGGISSHGFSGKNDDGKSLCCKHQICYWMLNSYVIRRR